MMGLAKNNPSYIDFYGKARNSYLGILTYRLQKIYMHYAFCLFKYSPFSGLARDFMAIAKACLQRGHSVDIYTQAWQGALPPDMQVTLVPYHGWSNHQRSLSFSKHLQPLLQAKKYAAVVGFNRMSGLDLYYAADLCFRGVSATKHSWFYRLSPRYRTYAALEHSVFAETATTQILLINEMEQKNYQHYYATADTRFHLMPPGIDRQRLCISNASETIARIRQQLGLTEKNYLLLAVGSSFHTKGIDRAIQALATLPQDLRQRSLFVVIGAGKSQSLLKLAASLGVQQQVRFLGGCDNVAEYMHSADILLHPARHETTGTVLLEALVCGLPVLVTENCGYAKHIHLAQAGLITPMPFYQETFNAQLITLLTDAKNSQRGANALAYAANTDLYSLPQSAAMVIEKIALNNKKN